MESIDLMNYWMESSDEDYETMLSLFEHKHYHWSLFVGHLLIERLLKGLYAKLNTKEPYAPKIHNLTRLAELCNLKVDSETVSKLNLINTFNQEARYETTKREFYHLCTKDFTQEQVQIIKELREWLKTQINKE